MNGRLYRSRDRILAGVAGGVADYFDVDPSLVRVMWAVSIIFGGLTLFIYIVMAIVVPEEPDVWPAGSSFGAGGYGSAGASSSAGTPSGVPGSAPDAGAAGAGTPGPQATGPVAGFSGVGPSDWRAQRRADRDARRAERWARRQDRWERRGYDPGSGALVFGILLILLGAAFLAHQVAPGIDWGAIWPVAIIAVGVILLVGSFTRRSL